MAARKRRIRAHRAVAKDPSAAMAESAQRIWLAGLGAFERAREEGPKMFDALVAEGRGLGGKARQATGEALRGLRDGSGLARLQKLGRGDVSELTRQVRELGETIRRLATSPGGGKATAKRGTAKRSAAKRKVKRAVRAAARRSPRKARSKAR